MSKNMKYKRELALQEQLLYSSAIDVYKMVLNNSLKKFPNYFWGKPFVDKNAKECTKYLIEHILKWNEQQTKELLSAETFKSNKLAGMLSYFNGSPYMAINHAYPNKYKPWEFNVIPIEHNNSLICSEATKWVIEEKLKLQIPEDLHKVRIDFLKENNLYFIIKYFNYDLYNIMKNAYPSVDFSQYDLFRIRKGDFNKDIAIERLRWYFEEKLGIRNKEDLYSLKKISLENEYTSKAFRVYKRNLTEILTDLYGEDINFWLLPNGIPPNYFSNRENRIKAIKWLVVERLNLDFETELYRLEGFDFKKNKLERMYQDFYSNNMNNLYLDIIGESKEDYIKKLKYVSFEKTISPTEFRQSTYINIPNNPFKFMVDTQETNVCYNGDIYPMNIKVSPKLIRLNGFKNLYKLLELKEKSSFNVSYDKEINTFFIVVKEK